jgi:hypothetical protein
MSMTNMRMLMLGLFSVALLIAATATTGLAIDPEKDFPQWGKVVSAEATFAHFGPHLSNSRAVIQAWNLAACFSLLPFGIARFRFLNHTFDGALEVGLKPVFERFQTQNQNFGGLGLNLRYYLLHFRYGRLVPWINGSIAPGGSDLNIGRVSNETRLTGPFMDLIQGSIGASFFITQHSAIYLGLQAQHFSNGGFNGSNRNFSLNTPESAVIGVSWFSG